MSGHICRPGCVRCAQKIAEAETERDAPEPYGDVDAENAYERHLDQMGGSR